MIFEAVINVSEGIDSDAISAIEKKAGGALIDTHRDTDHHRSVFTLASRNLSDVYENAQEVVRSSFEILSLISHEGVHPRVGVVDVVPFVSYNETMVVPSAETIDAAHEFGEWAHNTFSVPVFYYDDASEISTSLPDIRKNCFDTVEPDLGEVVHQQFGSLCVGAREPLIAINVNLETDDIDTAQSMARKIRQSSGGLNGVRAIGLDLASQKCVQVSMNIVDAVNVNAAEVCERVMSAAHDMGIKTEVELVGLVPKFQYEKWSRQFCNESGLDEKCTVESRID